jgi:hypothetical protein
MTEQQYIPNSLALVEVDGEPRIDSRIVAGDTDDQISSFEERLIKGGFELTDMIEFAVKSSLDGKNEVAVKTLNFIDKAFPRKFPYILHAARMEIVKNFQLSSDGGHKKNNLHSEFAVVHYWFRNNCEKVIPGGVINRHKKINGYNPDFFVNVNGNIYPVECKKTFNDRALNQLKDYMAAYKSKHGYAVAFSLKTELPKNITFIQCPR